MAKKKDPEMKIVNEIKLTFSQLLELAEKVEEFGSYDEHSLNDEASSIILTKTEHGIKAEIRAEWETYDYTELHL